MAKRTSNDGKFLEKVVAIINEAYKDLPNTEILKDVKIADKEGGKGQIDVLIKTVVNGYHVMIAIECKDYSRPIEKDKILAFNSKCNMIECINKKIFVASRGYQKGAINAAQHFEINLYDLNDITVEEPKFWLSINSMRSAEFVKREIEQYSVYLDDGTRLDMTHAPNTIIFVEGKPVGSLAGFFYEILAQNTDLQNYVNECMDKKLSEIDWSKNKNDILRFATPIIWGPDQQTPMLLSSIWNKSKIQKFEVFLAHIFKIHQPTEIQLKRYHPVEKKSNITDVVMANINGIEIYRVIDRQTSKEKVLFLNGDGKINRMNDIVEKDE